MAEPNPAPRARTLSRRHWTAIAIAAVIALVAGGGALYLRDGDVRGASAGQVGTAPTPAGATVAGSAGAGGATPSGSRKASSKAVESGNAFRYDFDAGVSGQIPEAGRRLSLSVAAVAGGGVTTEPRDGGLAVRFPAKCDEASAKNCPRAVLESGPAEALNPGAGPIRYGAAVKLAANETAKGANVLQKGYSQGGSGSQFKLQIDGAQGRPSCVLVGTGSPEIHVLNANVAVADGQWHVVECARNGESLRISVDGKEAGSRAVPAGLSIQNTEPLRIGGKGTSANNDQFHGAIDDVTVILGA